MRTHELSKSLLHLPSPTPPAAVLDAPARRVKSMVGSSKHPLRYYQRERSTPSPYSGFAQCAEKLAMATRLYQSEAAFGSDDTVPQSPAHSYSSPMTSSPARKLYTPEPPSSPMTDPFVLSSPPSSFDSAPAPVHLEARPPKLLYAHDYQPHPSNWLSRRRSSSLSAPTLVSDMDQSEYSDVDFSTFSDDAPEPAPPFVRTQCRPSVKISDLLGPEDMDPLESLRQREETASKKAQTWDMEFDIASALLDLSRQVRISANISARSVSASPTDVNPLPHASDSTQLEWRNRNIPRDEPDVGIVSAKQMSHAQVPHVIVELDDVVEGTLSAVDVDDVTRSNVCHLIHMRRIP